MFVFYVDAEPLRTDRYPPGHVPCVKARVLVNHYDPEEAHRLALVALAEEAWVLRMVERIDVLPGSAIDDELQPLADESMRSGVALSVDS